ncbi:hypothetical protein D3C86_1455240 [compost metagenome]
MVGFAGLVSVVVATGVEVLLVVLVFTLTASSVLWVTISLSLVCAVDFSGVVSVGTTLSGACLLALGSAEGSSMLV